MQLGTLFHSFTVVNKYPGPLYGFPQGRGTGPSYHKMSINKLISQSHIDYLSIYDSLPSLHLVLHFEKHLDSILEGEETNYIQFVLYPL